MNAALATHIGFDSNSDDRQRIHSQEILWAVFGCLTALAVIASALFLRDKYMYGALVLATPVALIVACSPRLALYQFVFCLFLRFILAPGLTLVDLSALTLIAAAIIDALIGVKTRADSKSSLTLAKYYGAIIVALAIAGIFAFDRSLALRPILRVTFILGSFLALIQLLNHTSLLKILKFYFWLAVANSVVALIPFLVAKGAIRSFGFTGRALDELTMLALPLGLALFLGATKETRLRYGLGLLLVLGGLVATQSRAPIMFATIGVIFIFASARRIADFRSPEYSLRTNGGSKRGSTVKVSRTMRRRTRNIILFMGGLVLVFLILSPEMFSSAVTRFDRLITTTPGGTYRLRMTLWKSALLAFSDNPFIGIGPGNFKSIGDIYGTLHMDGALYWIRGLSAHNLLLQYLAEAGLVGGLAALALFWKQFHMAKTNWGIVKRRIYNQSDFVVSLGLNSIGTVLFLTTFLEAGWLWSQTGFLAAFFLAAISFNYRSIQTSLAE